MCLRLVRCAGSIILAARPRRLNGDTASVVSDDQSTMYEDGAAPLLGAKWNHWCLFVQGATLACTMSRGSMPSRSATRGRTRSTTSSRVRLRRDREVVQGLRMRPGLRRISLKRSWISCGSDQWRHWIQPQQALRREVVFLLIFMG